MLVPVIIGTCFHRSYCCHHAHSITFGALVREKSKGSTLFRLIVIGDRPADSPGNVVNPSSLESVSAPAPWAPGQCHVLRREAKNDQSRLTDGPTFLVVWRSGDPVQRLRGRVQCHVHRTEGHPRCSSSDLLAITMSMMRCCAGLGDQVRCAAQSTIEFDSICRNCVMPGMSG